MDDDYSILEWVPDAIVIIDSDSRIVSVNRHAEAMFGYSRNELIGRPVELLIPERHQDLHVTHRARYCSLPEPRTMGQNLQLYARRRNGTETPVDVRTSPLAGEAEQTICTIRDISDRKLAEDALRESEARYRSLVQGATYCIYRTSVDGRILYVNPALVSMLGYERQSDLLQLNARELYVDPAERDRLVEAYRASTLVTGVEARWKRREGTPVIVKLSGRILRDPDACATEFEMIVEDVTQRRLLEERLRMAEKLEAVGRLTAGIAHHFNNLLTTILGRIDLAKAALPPASPASTDLAEALAAVRAAATLIVQMQAFGQETEAAPAPLDLNDVLNELAPLLTRELSDASVAFVLELRPSLPLILMDRAHLEGITLSLVTNAREAMQAGGTLKFSTAYDRRTLRVKLVARDTGSGMSEQTRRRIFDPFFTTREVGEGAGLGLSVVYGLVSRSGGSIQVESEPGRGTAFIMEWPALAGVDETQKSRVAGGSACSEDENRS